MFDYARTHARSLDLRPVSEVLRRDAFLLVTAAFAVLIVGVLSLKSWSGFWYMRTGVPMGYEGDALSFLYRIQLVLENGVSYLSDRYGYPFGAMTLDFPQANYGSELIVRLIGLFFDSPFDVFNAYVAISFLLVFVASFVVLRVFNVTRPFALAGGVLYTFLLFHYARIPHLYYVMYFSVPMFYYVAGVLYSGGWSARPTWHFAFILSILVFVFSSFLVYYALFGVMVIGVAVFLRFLSLRSVAAVLPGVLMILLVVIGLLANLSPNIGYVLENGRNAEVAKRNPGETEIHGLKLVQLVLPGVSHNWAPARNVSKTYSKSFPLVHENSWAGLGLVGSVGLLILFIAMLSSFAGGDVDKRLLFISPVVITLFIVGTIGGVSSLFALFVTDLIRAWNRISVFIAFGAIMAAMIWMQNILTFKTSRRYIFAAMIVSLLLIVFGLFDQVPRPCPGCHKNTEILFASDKEFFAKVEGALPAGAAVYQLPYSFYPERGRINGMPDYEHVKGGLFARDLKWSYGGIKGREGDYYFRHLAGESIEKQLDVIRKLGFGGVYIDRRGFKDFGHAIEADLQAVLGAGPSVISRNGNQSLFVLESQLPALGAFTPAVQVYARSGFYADKYGVRYPAKITDRILFGRGQGLPSFIFELTGLAAPEAWGVWSDAAHSRTVVFKFNEHLPNQFMLDIEMSAFGPNASGPTLVKIGRKEYPLQVGTASEHHRLVIDLNGEAVDVIEIVPYRPISPEELGASSDNRKLGVGLRSMSINLEQGVI